MAKILAIDLGTTFYKVSLFDRSGRLCDTCRIAPDIQNGPNGLMEMTVDAFRDAVRRGIGQLRGRTESGLADVEAIAFATQTNSFVLLDAENHALTPIILWPDLRAAELAEEVRHRCDLEPFSATTGIPQMGAEFMVAKLLWLQQRMSPLWARTDKVALISDYLTLWFTGKHVTEAGAMGLTGLLDIHRCEWWPEMLQRFSLARSQMPAVVRAGTDLGPIDRQVAEEFGLPETCRFVVGCLDQYAGAIGAGNLEPGMVSETTGTVLATVECADHFGDDLGPGVFQGPGYRQGLYWRMAFGNVSANYLQWYRDQLPDRPEFDALTALAAEVAPGADGLRLRTDARPSDPARVFVGMTSKHGRGHAVRCILETVAGALRDQSPCFPTAPRRPRSVAPAGRREATFGFRSRPTRSACPRLPRSVKNQRASAPRC